MQGGDENEKERIGFAKDRSLLNVNVSERVLNLSPMR